MKWWQSWRYQCDFCGKRGNSGGHMQRHEKYCTANPCRECRMHPHVTDEPVRSVPDLAKLLGGSKPDYGMAELREAAGDCPMCILAAIRWSGIQKWDGDPESSPPDLQFNYKAELKAAWETANDAEVEAYGGRYRLTARMRQIEAEAAPSGTDYGHGGILRIARAALEGR